MTLNFFFKAVNLVVFARTYVARKYCRVTGTLSADVYEF
jgi:hypothetical protein